MHVQDLKRWHWAVIALVVGLALSYVWSSVEWDENLPTIGQRDFETGLTTPFPREKHLANVTVMPPQEGKYKVVAEQVRNTKTPGAGRGRRGGRASDARGGRAAPRAGGSERARQAGGRGRRRGGTRPSGRPPRRRTRASPAHGCRGGRTRHRGETNRLNVMEDK